MNIIKSIQARSQTLILKLFRYSHHGRKMAKLYNINHGDTCFIVGNGPSLTTDDLEILEEMNIDTFAVNRIYKIFKKTKWRPTYYVSTDSVLIRGNLVEVNEIDSRMKFIPLQNKYYHDIKVDHANYFFRNDRRENDQTEGFSLNATNQVNVRGTVTIVCAQLAMHLGYKKIYFIGVDHSFNNVTDKEGKKYENPNAKNYFCDDYDNDVKHEVKHNLGNTTNAYSDLKSFVDTVDVDIYNASRNSLLEVFEKVNFDEVISDFSKG